MRRDHRGNLVSISELETMVRDALTDIVNSDEVPVPAGLG